jgi:hypothetical protein
MPVVLAWRVPPSHGRSPESLKRDPSPGPHEHGEAVSRMARRND